MVRSVPAVAICVENLPPRRDRRVWREAAALRDAGYEAIVIGQRSPHDRPYEHVDGVHLYTYRSPHEASRAVGFVLEYGWSFLATARLLGRVARHHDLRVVQFCNPPDVFFPLARVLRRRGVAIVFDHHDLVPELFCTRYGDGSRVVTALEWCERATLRGADHVIATNESYRAIEIARGGVDPSRITVVRNGPDPETMSPGTSRPELRRGRDHLAVWFGNMGRQDGVDRALRAIADLVHERGRTDTHFVFCGRGEMLEAMKALAADLDVDHYTTFTGWVSDEDAFAHLSTADLGLSADPPGPLNDVSTMNKTLEYMAFGLPVVAYDLPETRVSAGDAALYASDDRSFADAIEKLLDDEGLRRRMGALGRQRVVDELAWPHQARRYVESIDALVERRSS